MKRLCLFVLVLLSACRTMTIAPTQTSSTTLTVVPTLGIPVRYELHQPQPADLLKMI